MEDLELCAKLARKSIEWRQESGVNVAYCDDVEWNPNKFIDQAVYLAWICNMEIKFHRKYVDVNGFMMADQDLKVTEKSLMAGIVNKACEYYIDNMNEEKFA